MVHNGSAMTGIELEQFMDRLEAERQDNDADTLLAHLRAQPLKADSLASIDRLHVLWMNAGDSAAARAVLVQDGAALLETVPGPARAELRMNLAILRLRVANFLDEDEAILQVLQELGAMAADQPDFDLEYYRRHRIFDELEQGHPDVALKTIEVRYALAQVNPARSALRAWDEADRQRRQARVLASCGRDAEARTAALAAATALRTAGPDQDIDESDWLWLGNALIDIVPLRLALFEQPIVHLTADRPLPQRREWEVRMARLAARALHAQGDVSGALKICSAAALSLDSSGGNNFIEYELPWLIENRQIDAAGHRAFIDVYEMRSEMWPGTARLVHERLLEANDLSVWWPLCVMRACDDQQVLESFLSALPPIDPSGPAPSPLLEALHDAMDDPDLLESVYAQARAEAQRRAPEHPWITRLTAVRDADARLIDSASELALLQSAAQTGRLQDNRTAYSLFAARVKTLGVIETLKLPPPVLASGMYAYNYALSIENLVDEQAESLPAEAQDLAYTLLRDAQKNAYEQGQAHMERYFATGSGHPFDACAHLYSMLCNNLAINYRCYNNQNQEAIDLHLRGIAASPFAEHYCGILTARTRLEDHPGVIEAAEQLWHYSMEFGYSRHDPDDYLQGVAYALYSVDRDSEILIWLERVLKWQEQQGVSDQQLSTSALFARLKVARYLAYAYPDNAYGLWQRYEPLVNALGDVSLMFSAGDIFKVLGRKAEAIDYYQRTLALCSPDVEYDVGCKGILEELIAELQAPEKTVTKSWWQLWK